jgi:hypothetical protein
MRSKAISWSLGVTLAVAMSGAGDSIAIGGLADLHSSSGQMGVADDLPDGGAGRAAVKANDFLNSLGAVAKFDQGANSAKTAPMVQYLGLRTLRANGTMASLISLHNQTGVQFDIGLNSGPSDNSIPYVLNLGHALASAGALLSLEGANEPNNFGGTYHGHACCLRGGSWSPIAEMQRDFYRAVKADPVLKAYPVLGVSEVGAETNNVGLQYLKIPTGGKAEMPTGTIYADYVNNHNYVSSNCHTFQDNQAYNASVSYAVPCFDGIWNENGITWAKGFKGYTRRDLNHLPKVTTETGWWTDGTAAGDDRQGKVLLNTYLDQYRLGWKYTYVYEIMDFTDGKDGFYANYATPRLSATYLHNLTSILADNKSTFRPRVLAYSISDKPETVHDMLMQKSNGLFELAIWGEQASGSKRITVNFRSARSSLKVYDPTLGAAPLKIYSGVKSIPFTMTDHVFILETH